MNSKRIGLETVNGREEDILEKIAKYIEIAYLKRIIAEKFQLELEKIIIDIDNIIQDLNEINQKSSRDIVKETLKTLKSLSIALDEGNIVNQDVLFLQYFLYEIHLSLTSIEEIGVSSYFKILESMKIELSFMPKIVVKESHIITLKNERVLEIEKNKIQQEKQIQKLSSPLEMEVFLADEKDSKSLQTLALLIETLNSIKGAKVIIEDIIKGSIISRLKVYFKSPEAKKEAIELLESTKKFATGKLEKEFHENEKLKKESEKIEAERQQITDSIALENSEQNQKKRELEIESLALDNEKKKLDNQKLELEIFTQKTVLLKQLFAEQLLTQEEFQILINKQLFIAKNGNTITIGKSIKEIESQ